MEHIGFNRFPNELVSNEIKKSKEFGKQYASAIWRKWQPIYHNRKKNIQKLRKYAAGEHCIEKCKKNISGKYTDIAFWEIDWDNKINILPTLLRNYYNSVDMRELQPIVKAVDPSALEFKTKRKEEKLKLFHAKDFIQQATEINGGQSPIPLDSIPLSKEQIELEEQTAEPLKIEKAETLVLETIARDNLFHLIQKEVLEEMVVTNYGIAKVSTCPIKGVKIESVKIENFIHGETSNKYFSDCPYYGEIKYITVGQLKNIAKESGISLNNEKIRKMARCSSVEQLSDHLKIKVLFYAFKTFFEEEHVVKKTYSKKANKKTNAIKLIPKNEYKPKHENEKIQHIVQNYDVWLEGIMVLDAENTIIRHRVMKNIPENKIQGGILPPYIVFTPRHKSIVEEVSPIIDSLQELKYRIIHHRNTLKGVITDIDLDTITGIKLGNQNLSPLEVLSIYFTKGIRFRKTVDEDGDPINKPPSIGESDSPIPRALIELTSQYLNEIQQLQQTFGAIQYEQVNPDPKTLAEIEMYRFSNNTSLRDYTDSLYEWSVQCYQTISSRINDAFHWKNIRDKFVAAIGTDDVEVIEAFKKQRGNHYFGVYIDYIPTAEEKLNLQKRLELYVQQGIITPLDEMRITNTRNRIQALSLLNLIIMNKQKELQAAKEAEHSAQMNVNAQSAIISQEEKRKTLAIEHEYKLKILEREFEIKTFLQQKEGEKDLLIEQTRAEAKIVAAQWAEKYAQDLAMMKKEVDKQTRLESIEKSKELESKLIDQRKGKIEGFYPKNADINITNLNDSI